jgi:AcrR family transcriptional regulator
LRAIAEAVGMSPASLYHYFPSKEAIMEALLERAAGGPREGVARLPEQASLREILEAAGRGFFRGISTIPAKQLLKVVLVEAHHRPEWGRRYLEQLSDPTQGAVAALIERALPERARRQLRADWLARQFTGALLSFVIHEELLRRGGENSPDREAYLQQLVAVFAAGVEAIDAGGEPRAESITARAEEGL